MITEPAQAGAKTVSLVLGSGGARGMAHIGAIRCLLEHGYDIRYISGTSIGALVGGVVVLVCRVFGECRRTVK